MESLFFCYIVTRESTKNFERNFAQWSKALRMVTDDEGLDEFLDSHIKKALVAKVKDFKFAFEQLSLARIQKYKMKYILAKLTQHVEQIAWGSPALASLNLYVDSKVEIEHILPQTPTSDLRASFDQAEEYDDWAQRLGNLTLLEKPINVVNSNRPFEEKTEGYRESKFLLTRALHERPSVGQNSSLNRAVQDLPEFSDWNSSGIAKRQEVLASLAQRIWLSGISPGDSGEST